MKSQIKLKKILFWDVDFKQLDLEKNKEFIVGRVLLFGDLKDFKFVRNYYGLQKIKKIACNLRYLDPKSLNFWSLFFKIPRSKFRCAKMLLHPKQNAFFSR